MLKACVVAILVLGPWFRIVVSAGALGSVVLHVDGLAIVVSSGCESCGRGQEECGGLHV